MTGNAAAVAEHRVMIVDDDEIVAALLTATLEENFKLLTVSSGEAALNQVASFRPEVVLLDIEMGGINGFDTCKRLRDMDAEASLPRPAVIFISSHDTLEERLQAYDSGGDDFVIKPPAPEEVLRKVNRMIAMIGERSQLHAEKQAVQDLAMNFLTNLGESGTALQFLRNAVDANAPEDLARRALGALAEYGLQGHVQLRGPTGDLTMNEEGHAAPLEVSVFAHVRGLDRIFQFKQRMVVNYPHVSLMANNLPIEDADKCGRLRDHLAIIAEGCETGMRNLARTARERVAIGTLYEQYRQQQADTRMILQHLQEDVARELMHLGLTDKQEDHLQEAVSQSIEAALRLFEQGLDFESQLAALLSDSPADLSA